MHCRLQIHNKISDILYSCNLRRRKDAKREKMLPEQNDKSIQCNLKLYITKQIEQSADCSSMYRSVRRSHIRRQTCVRRADTLDYSSWSSLATRHASVDTGMQTQTGSKRHSAVSSRLYSRLPKALARFSVKIHFLRAYACLA